MDVEADEVIDKWVCEFLLRQQRNPRVCGKKLFLTMRLQEDNDFSRLWKSAILRDIWNCLVDGTVDEKILDHLELLEKLLVRESCVILESLKSAYCWVAVECTVRYMLVMDERKSLYLDALERIWAERIVNLTERKSNLVTRLLMMWKDDLKNALEDPESYKRIRETNSRYSAVSYLREMVREHWALLGCPYLELEANRKFLGKSKDDIGRDRENLNGIVNEDNDQRAIDIDEDDTVIEIGNEQHGTDKGEVSLQQEELREEIVYKRNSRVAAELKDCLLGLLDLIDEDTTQLASNAGNGETSHNAVDVTPYPQPVHLNGDQDQDHDEGPVENLDDRRGSESEGTFSGTIRPHLPTPTPVNVSPLRRGRPPQHRNAGGRRLNKFWSLAEVEALRNGVKNLGKAWKDIKAANPVVLEHRTEVDLKDKWRNLVGR